MTNLTSVKGRGIRHEYHFFHFNMTSVVRADVIGSVNLLAKLIFAALDI